MRATLVRLGVVAAAVAFLIPAFALAADESLGLEVVFEAYKQFGWLGALGAGLTLLVQIWKTPPVQKALGLISAKLLWQNWSSLARSAFVFVLSLAGATITAVAMGTALVPALIAGVSVAIGAMGINSVTSALGSTIDAPKAGTPPTKARQAVSLVLPIDQSLRPKSITPEEAAAKSKAAS